MLVRLLGSIDLCVDELSIQLRGHRERAIAGILALRLGEVVATEQLAEVIWGPAAPPTASVQIQACVGAMRKRLAAAGIGDPREVLVTRQPGYLLSAGTVHTDLGDFRHLAHAATAATHRGDGRRARMLYEQALQLWRATPFLDVSAVEFDTAAERLSEERLTAIEGRVDCDLALGDYDGLVAELTDLVTRHPVRERLRGQLMLALYHSGRQAEALDVYAQGRRLLADELGLDPGEQLQQLQQAILSGRVEAVRDRAEAARTEFQRGLPTPRQLPADVATFVGRMADVEEVTGALGEHTDRSTPAIVCLNGGGGAGKTTFAVHVAQQVRDQFPDGQLYVHLGGTVGPAADPTDVLGGFLHAFDIAADALPNTLDERVALFRSCIADRRVLIVLDDAADAAQVRPLLPTTPGSAALVTSRPALVELDGARHTALGTLPTADAVELLRTHVGAAHVDGEPAAVQRIVELCGRLPLALRIAAARVTRAGGPPTLDRFARRLSDERSRLDLLQTSDLAVRATLLLSWEALDVEQQTLLRRLALLPTGPFPEWVAGRLLDSDEDVGTDLLEDLAAAHLVEHCGTDSIGHGCYLLHDLVRLVAAERLTVEDESDAGAAALARVAESWLGLTAAADHHIPSQRAYLVGLAERPGHVPASGKEIDRYPRAWLEEWHPQISRTVLASLDAAPTTAALLAVHLFGFQCLRRRNEDSIKVLSAVDASAPACPQLHARVLLQLCTAHGLADAAPPDIWPHVERAVSAAAATGDAYLTAKARERYGLGLWELAECDAALAETDALLLVTRDLEDRLHRQTLRLRSLVLADLDRIEEGIDALEEALQIESNDFGAITVDVAHYARLLIEAGRAADARPWLLRAIEDASQPLGDSRNVAHLYLHLAQTEAALGHWPECDEAYAAAQTGFKRTKESSGLDAALLDLALGTIESMRGHHAAAVSRLGNVLAEMERLREPRRVNMARKALADAYQRAGDTARARTYLRQLPRRSSPQAAAGEC